MKVSLGAQTVLHPTPVLVVGTYDPEGRANIMTAAWGGVCCSSPPEVAVSLRPATYSHGNIGRRRAFTVMVPSEDHWREADHVGMVSGRNTLKFTTTGLTPMRSEHVDAPYVEEFPLVLECELVQANDLGLHTQFIGEILNVLADEAILDEEENIDIERLRPMVFSPGASVYHGIGRLVGKARTNRKLGEREKG